MATMLDERPTGARDNGAAHEVVVRVVGDGGGGASGGSRPPRRRWSLRGIGVFAGLLVVLFHILIDFTSWTSLGALAGRFRFARLISPAIGAVIASTMRTA